MATTLSEPAHSRRLCADDVHMVDAHTQLTFTSFCDRTLAKSDWTHEAHLRVCWAALATRDPGATVEFLRDAIKSYNEATGVGNTPTSGYHETLTRYYVEAVASLDSDRIDHVIGSPRCSRHAPLRHWSRDALFSPAARARWIEPDASPLPWLQAPGETLGTAPERKASAHS